MTFLFLFNLIIREIMLPKEKKVNKKSSLKAYKK